MNDFEFYYPARINSGHFVPNHSHAALEDRVASTRFVLPVCSIGTTYESLAGKGDLVLPPLWTEAMDTDLREQILNRILQCFPYYMGTARRRSTMGEIQVKELPRVHYFGPKPPRILAFSVDPAVEQHGPHLPLGTDSRQSHAVLEKLADSVDGFMIGAPLDYGHLTWGLPFGFSIDLPPRLLSRYVAGYARALQGWLRPDALYVVSTHGSRDHHAAVIKGLNDSGCKLWKFRWLHEPLAPFASERGDAHAGGVETALLEYLGRDLVDRDWWPAREAELIVGQMPLPSAQELSRDLFQFIDAVESHPLNGIIGNLRNYHDVDAADLFQRMLAIARDDVAELESRLAAT